MQPEERDAAYLKKFDEPAKSRKTATAVIPAKAGIQEYQWVTKHWTPAFAGVTTFYGGSGFLR
jgi:hypothetical protein